MLSIGHGGVGRAVGVAQIGAEGVAERAVATGNRLISAAGGIVAAGAIGFARGDIVADRATVLTRREQQMVLEAMDRWRFVRDRVVEPASEFDAVVAAGIAHDDMHVADLARERI